MKKVLIISYYFPPYTGIEGHRAFSWYNHFKTAGLWPCIVTRHWKEGGQQKWEDYQTECIDNLEISNNENGVIHRLPYSKNIIFSRFSDSKLFGGLSYWLQKLSGNLHVETDAFGNFYHYCRQICMKEKPDFILVTSPPLNVIKIGEKLNKEFSIPFAVDFRDSFDNKLLNQSYSPNYKGFLENLIFKFYIKKMLRRCAFFTGVSQPLNDLILRVVKKPEYVITNGYDKEVFDNIVQVPDDKFRITILGNIYITQDIDFAIAGFSMFLNSIQTDNIVLQFIGLGKDSIVAKKFRDSIDNKYLFITDRLPRVEALEYLTTTSILYYAGWLGYKGVYSGKIFEYLGSKLPILIGPGDQDVLDQLLLKTEAGLSADTPEAMQKILLEWYMLWSSNKKIPIRSNDSIKEYTRKYQAHKLTEIIKVYL